MAKTPASESARNHNRKCTVRLSGSAERHAAQHQLKDELARLELGLESHVGDIVSLETGAMSHDFVILRRRWVISGGARHLEFILDHPVRAA